MRYMLFSEPEQTSYEVVFLVPALNKELMQKHYIDPFGLPADQCIAFDLFSHPTKKKTPKAEMLAYYTQELIPQIKSVGAKYIVVGDSEYFKVVANVAQADKYIGYVLPAHLIPDTFVIYVPNYRAVFYDPDKMGKKIDLGIQALLMHAQGKYSAPGTDIIHFAEYPRTIGDIKKWLDYFLEKQIDLTIDIEAFSLHPVYAGIGTITFCWNEHEGIAFPVDYVAIPGATSAPYGQQVKNDSVRALLKDFFKAYLAKKIFHNISYDVTVLIYQLFMTDVLDTEGLLEGLDTLLNNWDDTKLIAYLATNSCSRNQLSLKDQAQEFAGNYAQTDIDDITKIPLDDLLKYNLVDGLSTWFVKNLRTPQMIADDQEQIYKEIFQPAIKDIVQMQLTGLPIDMKQVKRTKHLLTLDSDKAKATMGSNPLVLEATRRIREKWAEKKNATYKKKRVTAADCTDTFNPNSDLHVITALYEIAKLPIIDTTDTGQPSVGGDTLKALKHHTQDPVVLEFLSAMLDFVAVDKILTSFIPAMEKAVLGPDGWHYLLGNFNLGGTVSGRLSSSNPNLQNLPSTGSKYAKMIKACFAAPPGWLFCGIDFASLEDRISALTTKDPNKLRVYLDGFDGHSLRAYAYFAEEMPDICQAPSNAICYKANVGGTDIYFHAQEQIEYLGQQMTGEQLYELLTNKGI